MKSGKEEKGKNKKRVHVGNALAKNVLDMLARKAGYEGACLERLTAPVFALCARKRHPEWKWEQIASVKWPDSFRSRNEHDRDWSNWIMAVSGPRMYAMVLRRMVNFSMKKGMNIYVEDDGCSRTFMKAGTSLEELLVQLDLEGEERL